MGIAILQGCRYSFFDMRCSDFGNLRLDAFSYRICAGSPPRRERFE